MSVRPHITLLSVSTVLTILFVISSFFPKKGISLFGVVHLDFVNARTLLHKNKTNYADISDIIQKNALINDTVIATLAEMDSSTTPDTIRANADSLKHSICFLQFPKNNHRILYPAFRAFENASKKHRVVRIMHYGDSQIESDRITSVLRHKLQKKFGGMGAGLVPVRQVYDFSYTLRQSTSSNWKRYTLYGNSDASISDSRYGILASFCRFTSDDTLSNKSPKPQEAWVAFSSSPYSYQNTKRFQQCRIFFNKNFKPFVTELYQGDNLSDADMYPATSTLKTIRWRFAKPVSSIKIVFKGISSPDFYGIALDGLSGIAVDNIPMRGSSGLIFSKMNKKLLYNNFRELNVKLIILEYGGNVVPYLTTNYDYYERLFAAQLKRLHEVVPGACIIVIGVADMSMKEKDKYVSYPNIEKVRNALRKAAFSANAAYWDMFKAMGGKNSMPSWVFAHPSLASSDFVHFNARGAKIIGQMFYNALIYEYNLYKRDTSKERQHE